LLAARRAEAVGEPFVDGIDEAREPLRLVAAERVAEAWDKLNRAARDTQTFNLERKPMVFNVFGWLAEASRG